jgi:hypothetical protein
MALVRVTLTAAITSSQLTFGVSSTASNAFPAVGAPPIGYQPFMIDDELAFLVNVPAANTVTVRMRGSDGTAATAHDIGSTCVTSATPSDFPAIQAGMTVLTDPGFADVKTYGQTGAMVVPVDDITIAYLNGTSAMALTLGAPSLALNGIELSVTSQSAFAHTITTPGASGSTGLFFTGVAGSPFTVATFTAQVGSSMKMLASNGAWNVVNNSTSGVTFS